MTDAKPDTAPVATPDAAPSALRRLLRSLDAGAGASPLSGRTAFVGFDAFLDHIARPMRTGAGQGLRRPFATMLEFGGFVVSRSGRNGSVELEERMEKLGGNAPILANALGVLGARVEVAAPLGLPAPHPCFEPLARFGTLHSIGRPGMSIALEFEDGKLMLAMNREIDRLDYRTLISFLPPDRLRSLLGACDLLAFVNWSELPGATDLLDGLARDVLPFLGKTVPLLVDLSDCTRRETKDLQDYLERLASLPPTIPTILSLNRNESDCVCAALGLDDAARDAAAPDIETGRRIREALHLDWVVFHQRDRATLVWDDGAHTVRTRIRTAPLLQTGAGDNFNAGLCAGRLAGLPPADALVLASAASSFYVEHARSAAWADIRDALEPETTP